MSCCIGEYDIVFYRVAFDILSVHLDRRKSDTAQVLSYPIPIITPDNMTADIIF